MGRFMSPKNGARLFLVLAFFFSAGWAWASGMEIEFKLSGGIGKLQDRGGDLEKIRQAAVAYSQFIGNQPYYRSSWSWKELAAIPDFEADIVLRLGKHFGVGIGSGFITGTSKGNSAYDVSSTGPVEAGWTVFSTSTETNSHDYKIQAVPIKADLYFFLPFRGWKIYGYAGLGYYFGKLTHRWTHQFDFSGQYTHPSQPDEIKEVSSLFTMREDAACGAIGFQGGAGLGLNLSSHLSLGLEVHGRTVDFKNWEGDESDSQDDHQRYWRAGTGWYSDVTLHGENRNHGALWFYESYDGWLKDYATLMRIATDTPSGSLIRNTRRASLDLDALGVSVSLVVHFNFFSKNQ